MVNPRNYVEPEVKLIDLNVATSGFFMWMKSRQEIITDEDGYHFMKDMELHDEWIEQIPYQFIVGGELVRLEDYYERINQMNLQYNNFEYMVFEVNGSCLFRDFLYNISEAAAWAESSRFLFSILDESEIYNSENYRISAEYAGINQWEEQFDRYMQAIKDDPIVDHNRLHMPYSISSRFWFGASVRTLTSMVAWLKFNSPALYEIYGTQFEYYLKLGREITKKDIDSKLHQLVLEEGPHEEGSVEMNGFYYLNTKMALILYSQFIRQSGTTISGYYNILMHDYSEIDEFMTRVFTGSTVIDVYYQAHKTKVKHTVSKRLCAFAMSSGEGPDSWSYFLNRLVPKNMTADQLKELLPCSFNGYEMTHCVHHDDIKFRNEGMEISNCPCPLVTKSMEHAQMKKERDNNNIGNAYYELTKKMQN